MSHTTRPAKSAFPLIVTAMLLLPAMMHAATLEAQKWDAVVHFANGSNQDMDEALQARVRTAQTVVDARMAQQGSVDEILILTAGDHPSEPVLEKEGQAFTIDLPNTVTVCPAEIVGNSALVDRATLRQHSITPSMQARLELQLTEECSYALEQLESGFLIRISPRDSDRAALHVRLEGESREVTGVKALAEQLTALQSTARTEAALEELAAASSTVQDDIQRRRVAQKQDDIERMLQSQRVQERVATVAHELAAISAPETQLGEFGGPLAAITTTSGAGRAQVAQNEFPDLLQPEEPLEAEEAELEAADDLDEPADGDPVDGESGEQPIVEEAEDLPAPPAPREEMMPARPSPEEGQRATRMLVEELRELERTEEPLTEAGPADGEIRPAVAPLSAPAAPGPVPQASAQRPTVSGNPMSQIVNIDFREMELANVVAILAHKAGINIIAGTELTGTVTANLRNVTLRQAMETVLRMNDLGLLEEEGIFRIVPYDEAIAAKRVTRMIELSNAKTEDMIQLLEDIIVGLPDARLISIAANEPANVIVISGPLARVDELAALAQELDVAEPVLPTITEAIKLNYSAPEQLQPLVTTMLTPEVGQVAVDMRARHLVVTDLPVVVEQVRELIKTLDMPVRQVSIEAMVVDAILQDDASTGVDWVLNSIRRESRRGETIGNLDDLILDTNLPLGPNPAGQLTFGILSSEFDIRGMIQAEVRNENGNLLSNPVLVTVENIPAKIQIAEEIPYIELTQTDAGGSQTNTEFKVVGTVLEVTPRVTHDDHIIVDIAGKESNTSGEFNGIPIEQKREIESTLRVKDGQTIFIGGLRKDNDSETIRKVPVLGDIPVINFMFRNNVRNESVNELLIFLTCKILPDEVPPLTGYQEAQHEKLEREPLVPNAQAELLHSTIYPNETRDPIWKWRRSE